MEKFPSLEKFYTNAVGGVGDNYEVWSEVNSNLSIVKIGKNTFQFQDLFVPHFPS